MESRYYPAKNVFLDSIDIDDYIALDSSIISYKQLQHSIEKPLKMILVFGRPGTGKSILLNYIYENLKYQKDIHYFATPTTNEKEFFHKIFKVITKKDLPSNTRVNFSTLVDYCRDIQGKREIIVLLDEAQMYSQEMMERIRLLADSRSIKFVIALHKTDQEEDVIAKEHFQSRIWEVVELKNGTIDDIQNYVHKKLLKKNLFEIANSIKSYHIGLIYKFTQGNYRETNKLLFTIFELYEYYELNDEKKIDTSKFSKKIIEMSAIKLGFINV
jgi:replication-associated recombination protein RarA